MSRHHLPPPIRFPSSPTAQAKPAPAHGPARARVLQRMETQRGVQITFDVESAREAYDGMVAHTAHMTASARLTGSWNGIRTGFVQYVLSSERIFVYKSEDKMHIVTVTRDLPPNTLDGLSGDSPDDLYYSRSGYTNVGANTNVDDTPSQDPPKTERHDNGTSCFLQSVTMHDQFHLMYVSQEEGHFMVWWEGLWGYNLTTGIEMTQVQGKKAMLRKFAQAGRSGSVTKSKGPPLAAPRPVGLQRGPFATSYGEERNRRVCTQATPEANTDR
jgi:hypothetical protein